MPRKKKDWGPPRRHIQVIDRAALVIRVTQACQTGATLTYLQRSTGLKHGTLHRILQSLLANRFLVKDLGTGAYHVTVRLPTEQRLQ